MRQRMETSTVGPGTCKVLKNGSLHSCSLEHLQPQSAASSLTTAGQASLSRPSLLAVYGCNPVDSHALGPAAILHNIIHKPSWHKSTQG